MREDRPRKDGHSSPRLALVHGPNSHQAPRKDGAFFAGYANTKNLSEGDTYSDAEDYETGEEEDGEDGEYETESDVEAEQGDDGETREAKNEAPPQPDAEVTADIASTSQATSAPDEIPAASAVADIIPDAST